MRVNSVINEDFNLCLEFFDSYRLNMILGDDEFQKSFKSIHKMHYCLMLFQAEFKTKCTQSESFINNKLNDVCSDIGTALFNAIHGSYKASYMLLRSSIENFLKLIGMYHGLQMDNFKKVSKLNEAVNKLDFINQNCVIKDNFNQINNLYTNFSAYVHTASDIDMATISCLSQLPKYNADLFKNISHRFVSLLKIYIFLLIVVLNRYFFKFHSDNRDLILKSLTPKQSRFVFEYVSCIP